MSINGLYNADGALVPFQSANLGTELATRFNAGVSFAELDSWLSILPDPDPVLRKRGDEAVVLHDLMADDQVTTAMLSRKNRVLNCPHLTFRAGAPEGETPTPEADLLYQRFMQDLERTNLRTIITGMLDAPFFGFTPLELIWRFDGDWWRIADIVPKPFYWFRFDTQNKPVFVGEYGAYCAEPRELPAGKFVFVTHHATYDNPYGLRLLSRCLWPVSFKRGGLTFYARFVERHGLPWVVGEAPSGADEPEKMKMARGLASMVQDAVAVIPHGASVKLEAAGQSQSAIHEAFLARQDRAISKTLMGQTLTIETDGKNSLAATEAHKSVADDLADADKAMVTDAWNEIAWIYTQVNTGSEVFAPLAAYDEPEDLNIQADLGKKLREMGAVFTREYFTGRFGLKAEEFTLAEELVASSGATATATEFTAPTKRQVSTAERAQDTLDAVIVKMLPHALQSSRDFVTRIENEIRTTKSYEDLEEALGVLLTPSMTPDKLESFLARAMTAAAGFGAAAVATEENSNG